jgi:hypothetical protein
MGLSTVDSLPGAGPGNPGSRAGDDRAPARSPSTEDANPGARIGAAARDALRPINQLTAYTHSADRAWQEINLIVAAVLNEARLRTDAPHEPAVRAPATDR